MTYSSCKKKRTISGIIYLMEGLNQYIDRYMGRYIGQHSTKYRPILGRVSAFSPLNDAHGVSRCINRDTVGGISVNHRLYIGQLSVKSWSIIGRYMGRYIGQYLTDIVQLSAIYPSTVGIISVDT